MRYGFIFRFTWMLIYNNLPSHVQYIQYYTTTCLAVWPVSSIFYHFGSSPCYQPLTKKNPLSSPIFSSHSPRVYPYNFSMICPFFPWVSKVLPGQNHHLHRVNPRDFPSFSGAKRAILGPGYTAQGKALVRFWVQSGVGSVMAWIYRG